LKLEEIFYKTKDRLDRKDVSIETFNSSDRINDIVKVVVGLPQGIAKDAEEFIHDANRDICRSGFGSREDNNQIISFIMSSDKAETARNRERAVKKAQEILSRDINRSSGEVKGHIVVFAPDVKGDAYGENGNITVLKDAYTDAPSSSDIPPDIMVRYALARQVSFYYNGNDGADALESINRLLSQISDDENVKDISDLWKRPLRIKALVFESIKEWKTAQKEVSRSL